MSQASILHRGDRVRYRKPGNYWRYGIIYEKCAGMYCNYWGWFGDSEAEAEEKRRIGEPRSGHYHRDRLMTIIHTDAVELYERKKSEPFTDEEYSDFFI